MNIWPNSALHCHIINDEQLLLSTYIDCVMLRESRLSHGSYSDILDIHDDIRNRSYDHFHDSDIANLLATVEIGESPTTLFRQAEQVTAIR